MMNYRHAVAFLTLFTVQFLFSCDPCDCPESKKYEVEYTSSELTIFDTTNWSEVASGGKVKKDSFLLLLRVRFDVKRISNLINSNRSAGFSSAFACDCIGDVPTYIDPISFIEVLVIDLDTQVEETVTRLFRESFASHSYGDYNYLLENENSRFDTFEFQLEGLSRIPDSAIFKTAVHLQSGRIITSELETVLFIN